MTDDQPTLEPASIDAVDFYWRRGCMSCMALDRQLRKHNIRLRRHNIWDDPVHAAKVRTVAHGNETVPTVLIGDRALVNPRIDDVVAVLERRAPHLVPDGWGERPEGALDRLRARLFG